jgi:hypothetical protein
MEKYILVEWQNCIDLIDANLANNPTDSEIRQVEVYYPSQDKILTPYVTSEWKLNDDDSQQITIQCSMEENQDITEDQDNVDAFGPPEDWYWGAWIITVAPDLNSAKAEWRDRNPDYNGPAQRCTILSRELYQESGLEFVFRKKREQAKFRKDLLKVYNCCAITGETTLKAIEAAHIIDKAEGGAEVAISNGILLRADIHRLYDARRFKIGQDGSIIDISGEISEKYKGVLNNKKVDERIISRIREALAERARLKQGG